MTGIPSHVLYALWDDYKEQGPEAIKDFMENNPNEFWSFVTDVLPEAAVKTLKEGGDLPQEIVAALEANLKGRH